MRSIIILILVVIILYSCNSSDSNDSVIGKYVNTFKPETIHYVELKDDSTFIHYYKMNSELAKENKGVWRLSIRPKKTEIIFDTWVDFGYIDSPACNGCLRAVKLKNKELIFDIDSPSEVNFKKEE